MKFIYKGMDKERNVVKGIIEALTRRDAIVMLKKEHNIAILFSLKRKIEVRIIDKIKERVTKNRFPVFQKIKTNFARKKYSISSSNPQVIYQLLEKIESIVSSNTEVGEEGANKRAVIDIFVHRAEEEEEPSRYEEEFLEREKPKFKQQVVRRERAFEHKLDWRLFDSQRVQSKNSKLKVPKREIEIFTKRLIIMLESGISLSKALTILQDTKNKNFKTILEEIYKDVESGNSLSYALSKFPKHFDSIYVALVSVGETSGALPNCLKDILEYQQQKGKITKKIKSAMVYPIIILSVIVIMMIAGSLFFIPMFEDLFESVGAELPFITKVVFWVADRIVFVILAPFVVLLALNLLRKINKRIDWIWRLSRDKLLLKLPVIKNMLLTSYMYQFSNTMALILRNGIKMLDGIKLTEGVINNIIIKKEIRDVSNLVLKGATLSEALSNQEHFEPLITNIVYTGEESGRIHYILQEISNYYRENLEQQIAILVEMIQPLSIILIALIVIPVVFALFLPILDLSSGQFLKN